MIKLYWSPRSRSFSAIWLLEETGLPYERVLTDISTGAQKAPDYLAINPMGKVPALSDGDAHLAESGAICAYVAERVPAARLAPPVGDPLRARYLHWMFFSAGCMEPAFLQKMKGIELPKSAAGWGSFDLVMAVVDETLADGPYLLGDTFSAADVMLAMDLWYAINLLKVVTPTPRVAAYVARCTARPAFQRAEAIEAAELAARATAAG